MKKFLITGSNGLLGQKIIHKLRVDDAINCLATSLGRNRISNRSGYSYQSMDITDKDEVIQVVGDFQPDVIINTAAMTNVDACEEDREKCWEINVTAVGHLIEACKKNHVHLVHLSTDFVFDGKDGPYRETDIPNPLSYYAKSKWESEKLIESEGLESWAIIRTIIVYGICEEMSRSNIVLWAKKALSTGDSLRIVDDQFRAPTFAEDLADACIAAGKKRAKGIYHVSGPETMSILELVHRIARYYGHDTRNITPVSSETLNQKAKRPPKTGFILDKARTELGYNPRTIEESLEILDEQMSAL